MLSAWAVLITSQAIFISASLSIPSEDLRRPLDAVMVVGEELIGRGTKLSGSMSSEKRSTPPAPKWERFDMA